MLERIIRFSIRQRWAVLGIVALLAALGIYNFARLPIDAVPDITNVQVQINTEAPGFSPLEAEQRVTYLVETAIAGLPGLEYTRSVSRYGLSQVTVVFDDATDIYFARQLVNERLQGFAASCRRASIPSWGRSPPGSARSSCTRSSPSLVPARRMEPLGRRPICARCTTGWSGRNCAPCPA